MTLARLTGSKLSKNAGVRAELDARPESGGLGWALLTETCPPQLSEGELLRSCISGARPGNVEIGWAAASRFK